MQRGGAGVGAQRPRRAGVFADGGFKAVGGGTGGQPARGEYFPHRGEFLLTQPRSVQRYGRGDDRLSPINRQLGCIACGH
jgi:hypothetical protein